MLIDFLLLIIQFLPTAFIALFRFEKYPILIAYCIVSLIALFIVPPLFNNIESLKYVYYYACFGIAHAIVFVLYRLQKNVPKVK